jgi:predicted O-methyltransferase YrrM
MEWDSWFQNKTFSTDWTSTHFSDWAHHLAKLRDRDIGILEIGSWEGRSAIFFLEYLPRSRITCIDTFQGGAEHARFGEEVLSSIETRFDSNLAPYGDRVLKIKSRSLPALDRLAQDQASFDLIYIDGSHARDDVLIDSVLAWRVLATRGICIWDDYSWGVRDQPLAERPQQAIDAFLDSHFEELTVLQADTQVIVEKRPNTLPKRQTFLTFPRTASNLMRFLTRQPLQPHTGRSLRPQNGLIGK